MRSARAVYLTYMLARGGILLYVLVGPGRRVDQASSGRLAQCAPIRPLAVLLLTASRRRGLSSCIWRVRHWLAVR